MLLRNKWIGLGILSGLYFTTRLYQLLILPIFTDEAIYIYWAKFIAETRSHWFIALTDGKPPVLTWIIGIFLSIFPSSWYLIAGRLPSVLFGFITLLGVYRLAMFLFQSRKISFIAGLFTVFSPFLLTYDRLALYDAQLTAMLIWSVYFMLRTARSLSLKHALLWGVFLGLGFLAKPPAILYLALTPICFLILQSRETMIKNWKKIFLLLLIVVAVSEGMNNLQRISGAYQSSLIKNQQFQQPIDVLIRDPSDLTLGNMRIFLEWTIIYYTLPAFLMSLLGFGVLIYKKRREGIVLLLLWLVPMLLLATVGRQVFPRYLVFITPYAILPLAYLLSRIRNYDKFGKAASVGVIILLLILPLRFSYFLLTDPTRAPLPATDYNQLVAEHPSGYGLDKVFTYIDEKAKNGKVTVVTQGTFGLYPYAFYLEYWGNPSVRILPKWPLEQLDEEIYKAQKDGKVIIVLKEKKAIPTDLHQLVLVEKINKPNSNKYPILLTEIR